jgi:hypothetical protein
VGVTVPRRGEGVVGAGVAGQQGWAAFAVARALLTALAANQVSDVLALCDPAVVCYPATRPARTVYEGHAGMAQMVSDVHAVWGRFQMETEYAGMGDAAPADGGVRVLVRHTLIAETAGRPVLSGPVMAQFTVRDGLVTSIESEHAPVEPQA